MNEAYRDFLAVSGGAVITHIGLVDDQGDPVGDARKPVTWTSPDNGVVRPTGDLVFDMTSGDDVREWRGYTALTGGIDYGGSLVPPVSYSENGTYTLLVAQTSIQHIAPS